MATRPWDGRPCTTDPYLSEDVDLKQQDNMPDPQHDQLKHKKPVFVDVEMDRDKKPVFADVELEMEANDKVNLKPRLKCKIIPHPAVARLRLLLDKHHVLERRRARKRAAASCLNS